MVSLALSLSDPTPSLVSYHKAVPDTAWFIFLSAPTLPEPNREPQLHHFPSLLLTRGFTPRLTIDNYLALALQHYAQAIAPIVQLSSHPIQTDIHLLSRPGSSLILRNFLPLWILSLPATCSLHHQATYVLGQDNSSPFGKNGRSPLLLARSNATSPVPAHARAASLCGSLGLHIPSTFNRSFYALTFHRCRGAAHGPRFLHSCTRPILSISSD